MTNLNPEASRLSVGIIGAGPVARAFGSALAGVGHRVSGLATTDENNRERVEAMLPGIDFADHATVLRNSDLVILAVPENALAGIAKVYADEGRWRPGQIVVHTAAGLGIHVLQPALSAGAIPVAIHPAMTFSGTSVDLDRMRNATFAITTLPAVLPVAEALVIEMGGDPVVIAEADRATYAEAVAVASDFSTAIINQAAALLKGIGVEYPGNVLAQVATSAVAEALAHASWQPATGFSVDDQDLLDSEYPSGWPDDTSGPKE